MVTFTYQITNILSNTQILSVYAGVSGQDTFADDTVSKADESLLNKYLKTAASFVAQLLSGYNKDLVNKSGEKLLMEGEPFEYDTEGEIIFRINMPETFNQSVIPTLDLSIKEALEDYVLYRVSKLRHKDYESSQEDYENALSQIRNYIGRRTKPVVRDYRMF